MPKRHRSDAAHRLSIVINRVRGDLGRAWTVPEMASIIGVSAGQLRRLLTGSGHTAPQQLLQDLRLSAAAQLLADQSLRVKEITVRVGIADGSHFCRQFRRRFGVSPTEFRAAAATAITPAIEMHGDTNKSTVAPIDQLEPRPQHAIARESGARLDGEGRRPRGREIRSCV